MTRPIKFRVWITEAKKMVDVLGILWNANGDIHSVRDTEGNEWYYGAKPILIQFTGLLDKNGKEIWEGDIFKDEWGLPSKIYWKEERACFEATNTHMTRGDMSKGEVIGNIYENPNLL